METDWRIEHSSVKDRIYYLLEEGYLTDCKFLVGDRGRVFVAHKLMLANASAVFEKMFFGSLPENTEKLIKIVDIEPIPFSMMLKYIYTDDLDFLIWEDAVEVYKAAKKYMIHNLKDLCIEFVLYELSPLNVFEIYDFAMFHEEKDIIEAALKIIREETITVLYSSNFSTTNISNMITLLEQNQLQATEFELFNALESLALEKGAIKKTTLTGSKSIESNNDIPHEEKVILFEEFRKAVKKIQFYLMSGEQFSNGPALSELLSSDESVSILSCIHRPSKLNELYPEDFYVKMRLSKNLPLVYLDIVADCTYIGRIIIELRSDIVPITVKRFLDFFVDDDFGFKGKEFFKIYSTFCKLNTYNEYHEDAYINHENFILKHNKPGTVSILHNPDEGFSMCGGFLITFTEVSNFNKTNVVVGHVVEGMDVVEEIKGYGTLEGEPKTSVMIKRCGQLDY